jgi:hypothetical protein
MSGGEKLWDSAPRKFEPATLAAACIHSLPHAQIERKKDAADTAAQINEKNSLHVEVQFFA